MKKLVLLLFLPIIIYAQSGTPEAGFPEESFDFGDIVEGVKVTHDFKIVNNGQGILEIKRVRASCGCTAVAPAKKELQAGESTTLKVEFDAYGRRGKQDKYVYVYTNDPENPAVKLSFTANVLPKHADISGSPKLELSTMKHDFGKVKEGEIVSIDISLKNAGAGELLINEVISSCGCTAALLSSKNIKPDETVNLRIELDTHDRKGKLTRTVLLKTNDPAQPDQVITLFAEILERNS